MSLYEDDFEDDEYDEQQHSSTYDSINDIKDTYDDVNNFYDKYKQTSSGTDTVNKVAQGSNNVATTTSSTATNAAGSAATGGAAAGEAAGGAAASGAAAGGAAASGAAAGGAAASGAAAGGAAAGGAAAAGPVGWIVAAVALLGAALKKEHEKRKNETSDQKVKRRIKELAPILIILAIILLPILLSLFTFSIGFTKTSHDSIERIDEYIDKIQSGGIFDKITGLELEEEIKGYDKPIEVFNNAEIHKTVSDYSKFSDEYFKFGEGLVSDDFEIVKEEFGLDKEYKLTKQELDSAILASFLSLQAIAFSKIEWIEATVENGSIVEKKIEEFDIIYDSKTDDSNSEVGKWRDWLTDDENKSGIEYIIKIPKAEKYSVVETKRNVLKDHTIVTTNGSTYESDGETGWQPTVYEPPLSEIDEKYINSELKKYLELTEEYRPFWVEPYAIYIATGDVEYAKRFYNEYLEKLSSPEFKITVKLNNIITDTVTTTITNTDTTTTYSDNASSVHQHITHILIVNDIISSYTPVVETGPHVNYILYSSGVKYLLKFPPPEIFPPVKTKINSSSSIDRYDEEGNKKYTATVYVNGEKVVDVTRTYNKKTVLENDENSLKKTGYAKKMEIDENDYTNLRLTYIYDSICKKDKIDFEMDTIAAAIEVVKNYFENRKKDNANNIIGIDEWHVSQDGEVGSNETFSVEGGWNEIFTSSSGKKYREYKQDLGYYANYDYAGYGAFSSWACPMVATSIFLEGFGIYVDPYKLYKETGALNPAMAANKYLGNAVATSQTYDKETTINLLKSGNPVAIHNTGWNSAGHYMTILDYDEKTDRVYLSEVHTGFSGKTDNGWIDINKIGIDTIYYIPKSNT